MEEGGDPVAPGRGRFHVTADDRLFVVYVEHDLENYNLPFGRFRLLEILEDSPAVDRQTVTIEKPMAMFYTAGVRARNDPSSIIDILGDASNESFHHRKV